MSGALLVERGACCGLADREVVVFESFEGVQRVLGHSLQSPTVLLLAHRLHPNHRAPHPLLQTPLEDLDICPKSNYLRF